MDGVANAPIYVNGTSNGTMLYVSLGRHHPALREPATLMELRAAILSVAPTVTPTKLEKQEVGIPFGAIDADGLTRLPAVFDLIKRALQAA